MRLIILEYWEKEISIKLESYKNKFAYVKNINMDRVYKNKISWAVLLKQADYRNVRRTPFMTDRAPNLDDLATD